MNITSRYLTEFVQNHFCNHTLDPIEATELTIEVASEFYSAGYDLPTSRIIGNAVFAGLYPETQELYSEESDEYLFTASLQDMFGFGSFMKSVGSSIASGAKRTVANYKAAGGGFAGLKNTFKGVGSSMSGAFQKTSNALAEQAKQKQSVVERAKNIKAIGENNKAADKIMGKANKATDKAVTADKALQDRKTTSKPTKAWNQMSQEEKDAHIATQRAQKQKLIQERASQSTKAQQLKSDANITRQGGNVSQINAQNQVKEDVASQRTQRFQQLQAQNDQKNNIQRNNGVAQTSQMGNSTLGAAKVQPTQPTTQQSSRFMNSVKNFGKGFQDQNNGFMGMKGGFKGVGNWAMNNKAQAATAALGTAAAGYMAYRAFRGPRQQPQQVQQQQPVNVNIQR